MEITKNIYRV